jgi:hypothetical protein
VFADTVFSRDLVLLHPRDGQHRPDPDLILISVRGASLAHDILPEARALVDPEEASDTACNATKYATDDATHRSSCSALLSATLNATNDALCVNACRQCENC